MKRRRAIVERWFYIILQTVIGCLVGWAILSLRLPMPKWVSENAATMTTGWLGFFLMTTFWAVVLSGGGLRVAFSFHNRRMDYPSTAVAVHMATCFLIVYYLWNIVQDVSDKLADPHLAAQTGFAFAEAAIIIVLPPLSMWLGILVADLYRHFRRVNATKLLKKEGNGENYDTSSEDDDLPEDLRWILDEHPVTTLEDDKFNRSPIIKRILTALKERRRIQTSPVIGVLGSYGSGKSTVVNFVKSCKDELNDGNTRIVFVDVPGWGIANEELLRYVLSRIVGALEEQGLDCMALRELPREYMAAVGSLNEKAARLLSTICDPFQKPHEVLQGLQLPLEAAGLELVVCIEDVERSRSTAAVQELSSMLERFRKISRVSFILEADNETQDGLDLARLCSCAVRIPQLPTEKVWGILCKLRMACVQYAKKQDDILPPEEVRGDSFWLEEEVYDLAFEGHPDSAFRADIAQIAGTPRVYKKALREVWQTWKSVHGEVDLTEHLLLHILRETNSEAWNFVTRRINMLLQLPKMSSTEKTKTEKEKYLNTWKEVTHTSSNADGLLAILRVLGLNFVDDFPDVFMRKNVLQSIHQSKGQTDYFHRIYTGDINENETRDQDILRAIQKWKNEKTEFLERIFSEQGFAQKVEQFKSLLGRDDEDSKEDSNELLFFCGEYVHAALTKYGRKADLQLPGGDFVRRLATKVIGDSNYVKWVKTMICESSKVSLKMAFDVFRFSENWVEGKDEVRRKFVEDFVEEVDKNSSYLGRVLDENYTYTLYHIMRFREQFSAYNKPEDWRPHMSVLMHSARTSPTVVVPHLATLLIRDKHVDNPERREYVFEEDYANKLIPKKDQRQEYVDMLTAYVKLPEAQEAVSESVTAVINELTKFASQGNT